MRCFVNIFGSSFFQPNSFKNTYCHTCAHPFLFFSLLYLLLFVVFLNPLFLEIETNTNIGVEITTGNPLSNYKLYELCHSFFHILSFTRYRNETSATLSIWMNRSFPSIFNKWNADKSISLTYLKFNISLREWFNTLTSMSIVVLAFSLSNAHLGQINIDFNFIQQKMTLLIASILHFKVCRLISIFLIDLHPFQLTLI